MLPPLVQGGRQGTNAGRQAAMLAGRPHRHRQAGSVCCRMAATGAPAEGGLKTPERGTCGMCALHHVCGRWRCQPANVVNVRGPVRQKVNMS
jgi:hypothetical protein